MKFVGIALTAIFVTWAALSALVGYLNHCGEGRVSIAVMNKGIYCVEAKKWRP